MKQFFLRSRLQKKHLIAVVILFQLVVVASMFMKAWRIKHYAVKNNTIVRISCTAYDPFNPFKGRYVRLTLSQNDLESEGKKLGIDLQKLSKNCSDYYMQENYANFIDKISSKNLNDLNPVLEVYVDKKDLLCNVNHLTEHSLMLFRPILRHQHQQEKLERNQYCF